ncbi:DUF1361 domain-containing protein [Enterococcus sp. CSURQ0835]|uniref:DUF1361 domain-containing protein n=1 Tax=Enterococcus sp. CSURQ0835 TaxID=2681394 RepID=UPI001356CB7A|nr:DUF1361 domain-containing protein [Enterococcus sp. CSURQ0835]
MKKINQLRLILFSYCLLMLVLKTPFSFMSLNVFLAWLPLEAGHFLQQAKRPAVKFFCAAVWLLFFPNIPYLLTDAIHLKILTLYRPGGHFELQPIQWSFFALLIVPIVCLVGLGMKQVFMIISRFKVDKLWQKWLLLIVIAVLSSLAIFIGRFDRIHSIELVLRPIHTLRLLLGNWSQAKLLFVGLFTGLQLSIWKILEFEGEV